jgi:ethylbenzene dioxygenase beta subunit
LLVHSVFVHHRGMGERDEFTLVGRREDLVRRTPDGLRLARRLIVIDQHVLLARNLNVFF